MTQPTAWLPGQWYPPNWQVLHAFVQALGAAPANSAPPPLAAFDWDNTCIFNDIADATLRYQLQHLQLRQSPQALADSFTELLNSQPNGAPRTLLAALQRDILHAYAALWPAMQALRPQSVLHSTAHTDFKSKTLALYNALEHHTPASAVLAFRWLLYTYKGFSDAESEALAVAAWQAAAAESIGTTTWRCATAGSAGKQATAVATGLHVHHEMRALMHALRQQSVDIAVVSASFEPLVRGVLRHLALPVQHVLGMRQPQPHSHYPFTYRSGKVQAIDQCLQRAPLLVAGDANTDYEMLTHYPATQLCLLIHRPTLNGPICTLHARALQASPDTSPEVGPRYLLQGCNLKTGCFWPQQRSA